MAVSAPLLQMGIKGTAAPDGPSQIRQRLLGELACEILVGSSSPLYNRLYEEGLINSGFYCGYLDYPGCAFPMAGGGASTPNTCGTPFSRRGRAWPGKGWTKPSSSG